jgi:hypothetical protein
VIEELARLTDANEPPTAILSGLLAGNFKSGMTTIRLILDLSEDEFRTLLKQSLGGKSVGVKAYRQMPSKFLAALEQLNCGGAIRSLKEQRVTWRDVLVERLKSGRGSAIKGQRRGRYLEDFVEEVLKEVFGPGRYKPRCRFNGSSGTSTAKADFAVPSPVDPRILIEAKAYGATGSKQTDILGDVGTILVEKRHDTQLLLVTDGMTWRDRLSDLRNLVAMQNEGAIAKIYTQAMTSELAEDLLELKAFHRI